MIPSAIQDIDSIVVKPRCCEYHSAGFVLGTVVKFVKMNMWIKAVLPRIVSTRRPFFVNK